jgi:hypothetical protein
MTEEVKKEEVKAHETSMSMIKAAAAELDADSYMPLKVGVTCSSACDLRGKVVNITDHQGIVVEDGIELTEFDGTVNVAGVVAKAPVIPGEYTWMAVFPAQEKQGILHEECSALFPFIVKPHVTIIRVGDVPCPIVLNTEFRIKAGVKCSIKCNLAGREIEIYDHEGEKVATNTLGDVPWPGTSDVYWAEVELKAPGTEGSYRWTAKFPKPDLKVPHEEASCNLDLIIARPPDCEVTVEAIDKDTKTPIENAQVALHPYRGNTDDGGVAKIKVARGQYKLYVWKRDYKGDYGPFKTTVEVADDVAVKAELMFWPAGEEED